MGLITKSNVKKGMQIFICADERPCDGLIMGSGYVTDIYEDHYLYHDSRMGVSRVWGFYDTELDDDLVVFDNEIQAKNWINSKRTCGFSYAWAY